MNKNLTETVIILDRSGSMSSCRVDMEGGLNSYIEEQKKSPGQTNVTFVRFDTEIEVMFENKPIAEVGELKLQPRGGTSLNDAIGITLNKVGERLAKTPEDQRPGLVDVIIVTDGGENSSREYSSAQVKEMVETQQNVYSWKFTYLGANQDAFAVGSAYGFQLGQIANYDVKNANKMFKNVSARSMRMKSEIATSGAVSEASMLYTSQERAEME